MTPWKEPAVYSALLRQGILMAALFGADMKLTPEQLAGLSVTTELIATLFTRQNVTPINK